MTTALPVIDVAPLVAGAGSGGAVGEAIDTACREFGFFCVTGHGVDLDLAARLDALAREFFALDEREKAGIAMARGSRAWRGWFPLGGELTSGVADQKEGIYFGADGPASDARLLHGPNLFPQRPADLGPTVQQWMATMASLARRLLQGIALGLGLDANWFERELTYDPITLFRIFRYPPAPANAPGGERGWEMPLGARAAGERGWSWGVAEHTDYGLLTILAQDGGAGLEVRAPNGEWIDVPGDREIFVCNLGDMLDRMTGGRYRSTPHRVRNTSGRDRLSFPFFFDPSWDAEVRPLPLTTPSPTDDRATRWDGTSLAELRGTYGEYLSAKVAKVFPQLLDDIR